MTPSGPYMYLASSSTEAASPLASENSGFVSAQHSVLSRPVCVNVRQRTQATSRAFAFLCFICGPTLGSSSARALRSAELCKDVQTRSQPVDSYNAIARDFESWATQVPAVCRVYIPFGRRSGCVASLLPFRDSVTTDVQGASNIASRICRLFLCALPITCCHQHVRR